MENKEILPVNQYTADDEIDLFELFSSLMQQWKWLVGITIVGVMISVVVAMTLAKEYELKARVALPGAADVMELANVSYPGQFEKSDVNKLFQQYVSVLNSRVVFNRFLQQGEWVEEFFPSGVADKSLVSLKSKMKEALVIKVVVPAHKKGSTQAPEVIELAMSGKNEQLTANFVNGYIKYAGHEFLKDIKRNGQRMVASEVLRVNENIVILRTNEIRKRKTRVAQLKDALVIANKVGAKKSAIRLYAEASEQGLAGLTSSALNQDKGLFLLGSDYLNAEIENLQERVSGDPYIKELPSLLKRLDELKEITFDISGVQPYRVDQVAEVDGKAEKPKRALIVAVGTLLAFFVAIFAALIIGAVQRRREAA